MGKDSKVLEDRLIRNQALVDRVKHHWIKIFGLLSYVGFGKEELYAGFDEKFGEDNWLPAHFFDGEVVSRYQGYRMYDEAYYEFLKANPDLRERILNTASEVIDFAESNIESGLDLSKQEGPATHLQDISVRRALTRLALEDQGIEYDPENLPVIPIFKGDHIVQIRDHTTEGFRLGLNPSQVPFHRPELGLDVQAPVKEWWQRGSDEDIYQRNKVLLVNQDSLELQLVMVSRDAVFLAEDKETYYELRLDNPDHLYYRKGKDVRRLANDRQLPDYCEIVDAPKQRFSELRDIAVSHLNNHPELSKKRLTYKDYMERSRGELVFDIDALTAKDPFDLAGFCRRYSLDLGAHYIGCISDLVQTVLQYQFEGGRQAVGRDKVTSSFSFRDGSRVVEAADLRNRKYSLKFEGSLGEKFALVKQFRDVLTKIAQGTYEPVDGTNGQQKGARVHLRYNTAEQAFAYVETRSGISAFSYDRVVAAPQIAEHHVRKVEKVS